jgi:hypothetical protein
LSCPLAGLPGHLGHWLALMAPLFSVLREGEWRQHTRCLAAAGSHSSCRASDGTGLVDAAEAVSDVKPRRVLLANMEQKDLIPWFMATLQAGFFPPTAAFRCVRVSPRQVTHQSSQARRS